MARFVIHIVIEGGAVADDVYVGPFRSEETAERKSEAIERRLPYVRALVRELLPGGSSLTLIEEEIQ